MVSALRLRATRQSGDSSVPPDVLAGAGQPAAAAAAPGPRAPRLRRGPPAAAWLRRLQRSLGPGFRRFGLGVSIAGAMGASAIGGGLLAARPSAPAAVMAVAATAPNAAVAAAPAVEAAASAHPAEPAGSATATAPASASSGIASTAAVDRPPGGTVAIADTPQRPTTSPSPPVADLTFGLDVNGDGIPDSLERFVRKAIDAPATRVAARRYYRVALPLAALAEQREPLTAADQNAVFRAAECYLLSAAEDGLSNAPNLNDRASLVGSAAARRMQMLAEALRGFDYRVGGVRRQSCS